MLECWEDKCNDTEHSKNEGCLELTHNCTMSGHMACTASAANVINAVLYLDSLMDNSTPILISLFPKTSIRSLLQLSPLSCNIPNVFGTCGNLASAILALVGFGYNFEGSIKSNHMSILK